MDINKMAQTPLHRLLHSIEANCKYSRGQNNDPVTWNRLARVMNVYYNYDNPVLNTTLEESIDRMFLMLEREQIGLQKKASHDYIARIWSLYVNNISINKTAKIFKEKYNLEIKEWVQLCFLTYIAVYKNSSSEFNKKSITNCEFIKFHESSLESFFRISSITSQQIRDHFRQTRKDIELPYHFLIRSVFLEYPIIDFGNDMMLAPHPNLLFRHSGEGLYRLISKCDHFDLEFGRSFQDYTGKILKCYKNTKILLNDKQIEEYASGKCCDYLLESTDLILLIECKAITFTANMFTDNVLLQSELDISGI